MPSFKRIYYGGFDVLVGAYLVLNAVLVGGGFADILGYLAIGRGAMILMNSF